MKIKFLISKLAVLLRNSQGFSLAEVLVAAGLLGVVSLGVMEITKQTGKVQKKANIDLELNQITYDIQSLMRDPASCIAAVANNDAARLSDPVSGSPFRVINGSDGALKTFTTIKRFKHDATKTFNADAYVVQTNPATATNTYGAFGKIRITSLDVRGKLPAASMTTTGTYPFVVRIGYAVTAPGGALGSATVQTGTITEVKLMKSIEIQATRDASGYVTACGADTNSDLEAACKLFGGTMLTVSGQMRCTSLNIYPTSSATTAINSIGDISVAGGASVTLGLEVNKAHTGTEGYLTVLDANSSVSMGPDLNLMRNFNMAGTSLSATKTTTVNFGTGAAALTTIGLGGASGGTVNVANTNGPGTVNVGAGSGAGSVVIGGGSGTGALTVNGGAASNAAQATIEGIVSWGRLGTAGQLNTDGAIELGLAGGNATPYIDFHDGTNAADYNTRIIKWANSFQILAGANNLEIPLGGGDSTLSTNLIIPTADTAYGSNMTRAVNKQWVYDVLVGAAGNTFFDDNRADLIIGHILNAAAGNSEYIVLRDAFLTYLASASGRMLGADGSGTVLATGANGLKTYNGTQCPVNYTARRIYLTGGTTGNYRVDCYPTCLDPAAPCAGIYANVLNINGGGFTVSASGALTQLCLNGKCRTNWAQGGNGPTPGECSSEGDWGYPFWYVYGIAANGSVKCRRWGGSW